MLKKVQALVHAIAAHLVRVANSNPHIGISSGQSAEPHIDRCHRGNGCAGNYSLRKWENRRLHLQLTQAVILLLHSPLCTMRLQRLDCHGQLSRGNE